MNPPDLCWKWGDFNFAGSHAWKAESCSPHFKHKSGGFTMAWPSCISLVFISGSFPFVLSECTYTNNQSDTSASDYVWFSSKATWSSLLTCTCIQLHWRWSSPITKTAYCFRKRQPLSRRPTSATCGATASWSRWRSARMDCGPAAPTSASGAMNARRLWEVRSTCCLSESPRSL